MPWNPRGRLKQPGNVLFAIYQKSKARLNNRARGEKAIGLPSLQALAERVVGAELRMPSGKMFCAPEPARNASGIVDINH